MKRLLVIIVVLLALGTAGYFAYQKWFSRDSGAAAAASYRTAEVKRQDVTWSISATGTVVPEDVIDVGAQVNGQIASFGVDDTGKPVDYRSTVVKDSVLARIDDTLYAADVAAATAQYGQAQAQVKVAEASRDQARARLDQGERDWARAQRLEKSKALSQADYDAAKSSFEQAQANVAVAEATIGQAQASVANADAALQRAKRNLFFCTISSPVSGVIIDRRVEIGQTVVSSLNAPSLFLIAKDLSRMQVLVQVNEADIGHVQPGEPVSFTVDAFPTETFTGEVRKVRLNATMTQNVVTYTVEIVTDNKSLRLLPYLTANVRFIIDTRNDVVVVPNAALRWSPPGAPAAVEKPGAKSDARSKNRASGRVWVLRDGVLTPINVQPGLSDGTVTEVTTDQLGEGDRVIIGEVVSGAANSAAGTNPFAPPPRGGRPANTGGAGGTGGGTGGGGGGR
ncbi:MAG: efflux RND transporter periplasmic adaptor subunit [Phycisphaerales bacterium]